MYVYIYIYMYNAVKDSRAAQDAISQAIAVMESFYKDSNKCLNKQ